MSHFDDVAATYDARVTTGVVGWLRRRERSLLYAALDPRAGDRILDAGCGSGFDAVPLLARGCSVVGVDRSAAMVEVARARGVDARTGDLEDFDLGETFDKVLCGGALEFCRDPSRALRRLAAHLAPGGRFVAVVPVRSVVGLAYRAYHATNGLSVHVLPARTWLALLGGAGLREARARRATPFTAVVEAVRSGA